MLHLPIDITKEHILIYRIALRPLCWEGLWMPGGPGAQTGGTAGLHSEIFISVNAWRSGGSGWRYSSAPLWNVHICECLEFRGLKLEVRKASTLKSVNTWRSGVSTGGTAVLHFEMTIFVNALRSRGSDWRYSRAPLLNLWIHGGQEAQTLGTAGLRLEVQKGSDLRYSRAQLWTRSWPRK